MNHHDKSSDEIASYASKWPLLQPFDEYNRTLLTNARPPSWGNPEPSGRYNLAVVGGGTAGLVTAAGAAGLGAKVALIERGLLGGDCLNVGCVPSKALLRCARAAAEVRNAANFGVRVPAGAGVDFPVVMERMRRIRAEISPHDSAARFRDLGVDVFLGDARFVGSDSLEVQGKIVRFARACIATGARAATPPVPGLEDVGCLTNETVFSLTELPRRLAVIGAGPIGCELAHAFARFGSDVYLIEAKHGVMPNEDPDAAAIVKQSLLRDGVRVLCCGKQMRIDRTADGKRLQLESHAEELELIVDEILVGAGRIPNVDALDLEKAGVHYDKSGVITNDFLQTSNPRIYAAGDVCSRYKFTHAADAMARIVIQNSLFFGRKRVSALAIPWCTYTEPEVAHVGLYPDEAKEKGVPIDTIFVENSGVDRAKLDGDEEGFLKIHVQKGKDRILGATLVCKRAGDVICQVAQAMTAGVGLGKLAETIHPYPVQAEIVKKAADAYNRKRLTPRIKRLFEAFLRLRR